MQTAPSLPAFEQVPLFDAASVGERVLSELEHVEPSVLLAQLLGVAACNFLSAMARTPPALHDLADCREAIAARHLLALAPSPAALCDLAQLELTCARATSLLYCFPLATALIDRLLLQRGRAHVEGSEEREAVLSVFGVAERERDGGRSTTPPLLSARRLPRPDRREYVLFAPSAALPAVGDRLYAAIIDDVDVAPSTYAAPSSHARPSTTSPAIPSSAGPTSRPQAALQRLRHLRGGARALRRMGAAHRIAGAVEEDDEEPLLRLGTAWQTHWPVQ